MSRTDDGSTIFYVHYVLCTCVYYVRVALLCPVDIFFINSPKNIYIRISKKYIWIGLFISIQLTKFCFDFSSIFELTLMLLLILIPYACMYVYNISIISLILFWEIEFPWNFLIYILYVFQISNKIQMKGIGIINI